MMKTGRRTKTETGHLNMHSKKDWLNIKKINICWLLFSCGEKKQTKKQRVQQRVLSKYELYSDYVVS